MLEKLNSNMERWNSAQEGARNTFPAQPDPNPRGQQPGPSSGGPHQEQAKAITVLRSGRTIGNKDPPSIPEKVDEEDSPPEEDELEVMVE